jgi:acetyl-CoA carboxylase carboxyl transferase subunit alpha
VGGAQRGRRQTVDAVGKALEAELKSFSGKKPQALKQQRRKKYLDMGSKGLAA